MKIGVIALFFLFLFYMVFNNFNNVNVGAHFVKIQHQKIDRGLEGLYLTLPEIEKLKFETLTVINENKLQSVEKNNGSIHNNDENAPYLQERAVLIEISKKVFLWHYFFPTAGLILQKPFYPPPYPFLPHFFSLWQLAPSKGKNIKVAVIDTGVAAFDFGGSNNEFKKNIDLQIAPEFSSSNFNLVDHIQQPAFELLPAVAINNNNVNTFIAGHGSHVFGLIAAREQKPKDLGLVGIAPEADAFMIKAFKENGVTKKSILIEALEKAREAGADIVNLSLKVADELDLTSHSTKALEQLINKIPYVVAASGNNGDPNLPDYKGVVEGYPARFDAVSFDVGALKYQDNVAAIPSFSQYQPGIGPLFVAPGFDIISTGIVPNQKEDSLYVFMAGTSMATAIMSGFVALMLAEFENKFTREQLLKACYCSALKMHNNQEWQQKVILGVLDMRMALFMLHVLHSIKIENRISNFEQQFDMMLKMLQTLLFVLPQHYANDYLHEVSFRNDFITYMHAAQKVEPIDKNKEYWFEPKTVEEAILYCKNSIYAAFDLLVKKENNLCAPKWLIEQLKVITQNKSVDLFESYDEKIKKRLLGKIYHLSE